MLQECDGPIWVVDDITRCFQEKYLNLIFPLASCTISLLFIAIRFLRDRLSARKIKHYRPIPTDVPTRNGMKYSQ
ncbi:hypothetical protein CISG_00736 [Coccidioides immitis RMSCC 3703]|uniref:Uncharacterized protein n=1 Tax=Coccidioides immitis RMSCC 3703 TaxID=454286 RepID=A0A0J8QQN6_COCIT|nr:hypothetical protein CISG_00736 [Coccidioides immitis RMSCC 3703]